MCQPAIRRDRIDVGHREQLRPVAPGLLNQAKAAENRLIDAEQAADIARAEFHGSVRRLQLAGGSLREIAEALSLSHQRVHQIVEAAGAGNARICNECLRLYLELRYEDERLK